MLLKASISYFSPVIHLIEVELSDDGYRYYVPSGKAFCGQRMNNPREFWTAEELAADEVDCKRCLKKMKKNNLKNEDIPNDIKKR